MTTPQAEKTNKTQKGLDNSLRPAQRLEGLDQSVYKGKTGEINPTTLSYGHFTRPDPKDEKMELWSNWDGKDTNVQKILTDEQLQYEIDKKKQIEQMNIYSLANQLIDSRRPETQDEAYRIMPELKIFPEQAFRVSLSIQLALRQMMRDGRVRGQDDIQLIYKILNADYQIPIFPLWDDGGLFLASNPDLASAIGDAYKSISKQAYKKGLFNPHQYGPVGRTDPSGNSIFETQILSRLNSKIKNALVTRLFPNLRNRSQDEVSRFVVNIMTKQNQYTESLKMPQKNGANFLNNLFNW